MRKLHRVIGWEELPENNSSQEVSCSFDDGFFSLEIRGYDGDRYTLTLSPKEVRILLSRSLKDVWLKGESEQMPDTERALWKTLFEMWEKRIDFEDE